VLEYSCLQMSMACTSLRCCLNGLVLCNGRTFCVDYVRSEANCCVVAIVLMRLPVAHVRLERSERLDGSRCVAAECTGCQQYLWSAWMRSGVSEIRSAL
jgi:hypothetical protein